MAYGVKYQLIFSDVLNYGKKVEILKKDYTGEILPMIAGANPVQISWQSSDDFNKPIIGSKCSLSLLVTDSVSYDDFYKFDEREYKVVVSYAKSQGEIYSDRVIEDGGTVESYECVDNVLNNFETISTYYQNRVIEDGGTVESLSCVADAITDENFYRWGAYWSGFLVVDRYKEKMTTPPFGLTINAFDGLGTLNNFDAPIGYNNNAQPQFKTNLTRVREILDNLNLDLDIFIATDIKEVFLALITDFEDTITINIGYPELKNDFDLYSAKQMLESILVNSNARIYQSYNKWYIVESSNIFDYYVKDQILNEVQSTGVIPTGIRERISTQLNYSKKEFIDFRTYDKDGVSLGTERLPVLYNNNKELKATNNDLIREYLQPISEVKTIGQTVKTKTSFYNSGFEYGSYDFTIVSSRAEIATDEISFKGRRSMKLTSLAPSSGQVNCFNYTTDVFNPQLLEYDDFTFKIKYYIKLLSTSTLGAASTFQYQITTSDGSGTLRSWNAEDKTFVAGNYINEISSNSINQFLSYSTQLSSDGLTIVTSSSTINVKIFNTVCSNTSYETTYFDNLEIEQKKVTASNADQNFISRLTNSQNNTTIRTRKSLPLLQPNNFRTRENFGTYYTTNLFRGRIDIINRNIANDFRSFVPRYEGTFRNIKIQPLSFHNKVWFYWTGYETDPQSTIIDGLKYDIKNAQFKLKSHLPNDDDDEPVEFVVN